MGVLAVALATDAEARACVLHEILLVRESEHPVGRAVRICWHIHPAHAGAVHYLYRLDDRVALSVMMLATASS